jgi:hypothetical protein
VREAEAAHTDGLEGADLHAAVGLVAGAVQDRHVVPGQASATVQERGLVGLDAEQVVGLLDGDQELCGISVGLECVGSDHRPGKVHVSQQRPQAGHLAGGAVDLALGQHPPGGVLHGRQQVGPAGRRVGRPAASCRPPRPPVAAGWDPRVGQPRTDHPGQGVSVQAGQASADGGLGWYREVGGGVAAGAQRGADRLWGILGPLGDRGHRPGAGQHRGGGHSQDRNQRVAAATPGSRVADRGKVGQQMRGLGRLERLGVGQVGEDGWDRG